MTHVMTRWLAGLCAVLALLAPPQAGAQTTLALELADARHMTIDQYAPTGTALRGTVILVHGFTRSRRTLGGHAAALAAQGVLALTPDLPYTFDFERNAQALAKLVAELRQGGRFGPPQPRVVLVGFSAGGLSALLAAGTPGVVGYVGLDPFDRTRPDGLPAQGLSFAPSLQTEALLLRAPPSRCNAQSVAAPWAQALPRLWADRVINDASHCDFESPTDWICQVACGARDEQRQATVRQTLIEAIDRWLPRGAAN